MAWDNPGLWLAVHLQDESRTVAGGREGCGTTMVCPDYFVATPVIHCMQVP